jgi:hypothetical protein
LLLFIAGNNAFLNWDLTPKPFSCLLPLARHFRAVANQAARQRLKLKWRA